MALGMRAIFLAFALAACSQATPPPAAEHETPAPAAQLEVRDAWASPTPNGVDVSAGYLTIVNGTAADDRLIAVTSPRAARAEVHEMAMDGAVMRMRAVETLIVPTGGEVALAPGGQHLMFYGVSQPFAEGESIPVRLTFETAGDVDVSLPVQRGGAAAGH